MAVDWEFCLKYYRGEILLDLISTREVFHGEELVLALGSPYKGKPGLADNVATAEKLLRCASEAGLVKRGKWRATKQQMFFEVALGLPNRYNLPHRSITEFFWEKNYPQKTPTES